MNIGQRIKDLRSAKMMTQHELAGDHITRNMLSRIENGFALPSLPTLLYLAEKLGVPAGYLLADESEEFHYRKKSGMPDIMSAFNAGDWLICKDLCDNLGGYDDELRYIICLCLYNEAKDNFNAGNLRRAAELFESVKENSAYTAYPIKNLVGESDTYLLCVSTVSPSLVADIETVSSPSASSFSDPFCRYFSLLMLLDNGEISASEIKYERDSSDDTIYEEHLQAKFKMRLGHFSEAYHIMKRILSSDSNIPAPMLYFIFTDLEVCCRELSDYRGAYEYSADRTGMLEKFLG